MGEKTPAGKLRLAPGMSAAILHAPAGVDLGVPPGVTATEDTAAADFVLVFATTQAEAEERLRAVAPGVGARTILWMGYPKGGKAAGRDISRDTIAGLAPEVGLIANANFAIDDVWSAVRMRPRRQGE